MVAIQLPTGCHFPWFGPTLGTTCCLLNDYPSVFGIAVLVLPTHMLLAALSLLPTQCPNVVSGGETWFMELPHFDEVHTASVLLFARCGLFMFGTERFFMFARNIPKMHHFLLYCGANIYLILRPGIFSFFPHFDSQHFENRPWWMMAPRWKLQLAMVVAGGVMVRKSC